MVNVIAELDRVSELLEARLPASEQRNRALSQDLAKDMAEYFRALDLAIDIGMLETLYYKLVKE